MAREDWDTPSNRDALKGVGVLDHAPDDGSENESAVLQGEDADWLALARDSYRASTDFLDANVRSQWARNLRSFRNQHPDGSKYYSESYKHRSKLFRPKTRAASRSSEAAAAAAFFSTEDVASVEPADDSNPIQLASARINKELLNLRLSRKPIRWFLIAMGAIQDARTCGICISKQYWKYDRRHVANRIVEELDPVTGMILNETNEPVYEAICDEPACELVPPENIRFDPAADWTDPLNKSPYLIQRIPMFLCDVEARMRQDDAKTGAPAWHRVERSALLGAVDDSTNSTRQAREGNRQDAKDGAGQSGHESYRIVWVHENFMRVDGVDWHYYTLGAGATELLSEPRRAEEAYPHLKYNERPFTMGFTVLEAHKTYPSAPIELTQDLQQEANEIANQRVDNVRLAMNPRIFAREGSGLDLAALSRSVPLGVVGMKQAPTPEYLLIDRPPDVTASSYREQTLLNTEFDELAGNFSTGSVQDNRQIGETVGGMAMVRQASGSITDYEIKTLAESWLEPTLDQLVRLEQWYETDEAILTVAAKKAEIYEKFRIEVVNDDLMRQNLTVVVNAGVGSTDPNMKMARFMAGAQAVGQILGPTALQTVNAEEVVSEIFGILGYKDGGSRFFKFTDQDPRIAEMEKALQGLQQQLESEQMKIEADLREAQIDAEARLALEDRRARTQLLLQQLKGKQAIDQQRLEHLTTLREQAMQPAPMPGRGAFGGFGR